MLKKKMQWQLPPLALDQLIADFCKVD